MSALNDEWFVVNNIDELINSSRALVFNSFGNTNDESDLEIKINETDKEELDNLLSFNESKTIVIPLLKKQKHKVSKKIRYIMNDTIFINIITSLNDRMVSNIVNSLVNRGYIDTAYDVEKDDFVFWIKEGENNAN